MAGGISTQDQQALLKAISSPAPNYSGSLGEPSYPSGILSSGAYAPWAGIGEFAPTPMFLLCSKCKGRRFHIAIPIQDLEHIWTS